MAASSNISQQRQLTVLLPLIQGAAGMLPAPQEHTQWLQGQLRRITGQGCQASDEDLSYHGVSALIGRRLAFVLLEELEIQGPKNTVLMLPAGIYQVSKPGGAAGSTV